MTSYITTSDLEALNISSSTRSTSPHTTSTSTFPSSSSHSHDNKKVSFCSLAVLIELADEGEVEQAMAMAFKRDLGKKQLAVRTYSLETPSFSGATSRAWCSLRNGLSATLEPLLNTGAVSSSGVTSTSRRRESSPEREKYQGFKCPTQRPRRPRRGSGSWSDRSYTDDEEELLDDDPAFTPNAPTRLRLKIPTVTRRCSRPCLLTKTSKPILRMSTSPTSLPLSLPLPLSPAPRSASPLPSPSISSTSPRKPLPKLSTSPLDKPPLPTSHPHAATLVPIVECCRDCCRAAEYGNLEESHYVEHWSKGAKRLKEEQEKERREREEWAKDAKAIKDEYAEKKEGGEDGEEEEEDLSASQLGRKAKGVDELQLGKDKRHVKTITEKEDAGEPLQSQEREGIEIPFAAVVEEPQEILSGSIESTSPRSPFSDHEPSSTTPLTSPDTSAPTRRFDDSKPPPPSSSSAVPPPPLTSDLKRPPIGKQRSSSISRKVASFGSSFFGGSNGGISGAKFS